MTNPGTRTSAAGTQFVQFWALARATVMSQRADPNGGSDSTETQEKAGANSQRVMLCTVSP
jgi:hypothetical protein